MVIINYKFHYTHREGICDSADIHAVASAVEQTVPLVRQSDVYVCVGGRGGIFIIFTALILSLSHSCGHPTAWGTK